MPKCKDKKYESLYYKALSINKVNVHSPEGKIAYKWTTPDRVPHKHMWLWDSAFHALAMVQYNPYVAEQQFLAMKSDLKNVRLHINKLLNKPEMAERFRLAELKATDPAFYTSEINIINYSRTTRRTCRY